MISDVCIYIYMYFALGVKVLNEKINLNYLYCCYGIYTKQKAKLERACAHITQWADIS